MSKQTSLYLAIALIVSIGFWRFIWKEEPQVITLTTAPVENNAVANSPFSLSSLVGNQKNNSPDLSQGNKKVIENALPPGGDEFLSELNKLTAAIKSDLKVPQILDNPEMNKIIKEAELLITKVDQENGFDTPAVITQLLNATRTTQDPEIEVLLEKVDALENDLVEVLQTLQ